MTSAELIAWRKRLGLTAKAAAAQLGFLFRGGYAAYEGDGMYVMPFNGELQRRKERSIPKHVALACERLEWVAGATKAQKEWDAGFSYGLATESHDAPDHRMRDVRHNPRDTLRREHSAIEFRGGACARGNAPPASK